MSRRLFNIVTIGLLVTNFSFCIVTMFIHVLVLGVVRRNMYSTTRKVGRFFVVLVTFIGVVVCVSTCGFVGKVCGSHNAQKFVGFNGLTKFNLDI